MTIRRGPPSTQSIRRGSICIAARGDTVYLVWRDDRGAYSHVYFARSNDAGQHFLPNVLVDSTPADCAASCRVWQLMTAARFTCAGSTTMRRNAKFTYYSKSTNGGRSFLAPVRACDSLHLTQYALPSIAVSKSGRCVYVARSEAWNDSYPASTYQIKLSRSTDGGTTFLTPDTRVCPDTTVNQYDPTVAVFDDTIVVVSWDRQDTENTYFARSTNGGNSFEPTILLSDSTRPNYYIDPSIGVDSSGRVFVVFGCLNGVMVSTDTGRTFSRGGVGAYGQSLWVAAGGQLYLASIVGSSDQYVEFNYSPDAGQTFAPAVGPRDTNYYYVWEGYPTVCANREGRAFVAWEDNRDAPQTTNDDIYFATGTMSAIEEKPCPVQTQLQCTVRPNLLPIGSPGRIEFVLASSGRARLEVLDQSGRLVLLLSDRAEQAGMHSVVWSGQNSRGEQVSSGVYFVRLTTQDSGLTRKVILIEQ